ncbi:MULTISPECIES: GTP pyrophosphokinase [Bacillaceae]|uniref:GTP pyrophosphokinase family protein n=1 Tax=Ectobacillus funiculus TaxID=137993 RepID=A0ABV5WQ00_9BACI|nr:GTP pyrophosphokinase family protein [Ectobacillus funiculus]
MNRNWEEFLAPYQQAVGELKVKLRGMRSQFEMLSEHSLIEFVTGRVKSVASIIDKSIKRSIPLDRLEEEMQDIAGLRMMCQFVDDIKPVVELLRKRNDFEIVEERDYVTQVKASGYRSYHVVIRYPVQTIRGEKKVLVELQIRTLAMNFWATIEHSLNYKYRGRFPKDIQLRLQHAAEAASRLDEEMSSIRDEIQEAHKVFSRKQESE